MKSKLFILAAILGLSLTAGSAYSQVRVNVGIGTPVIYERDYPGYSYYSYPAWRGHYHDRFYYQHYHAAFEREHKGYFNGRRFDHERFERERHAHPYRGGERRNHEREHH
ncbi:MAG TPA: hypothetical protein VK563_00435 [Puia sp.]|nr:hypothetical protein [Puia sp.]